MSNPPERVTLTSEEGEALIERVYASNLPRVDCTVLVRIVRLHFWLMLALQEAKLSLKRFRTLLFWSTGSPSAGSGLCGPKRCGGLLSGWCLLGVRRQCCSPRQALSWGAPAGARPSGS